MNDQDITNIVLDALKNYPKHTDQLIQCLLYQHKYYNIFQNLPILSKYEYDIIDLSFKENNINFQTYPQVLDFNNVENFEFLEDCFIKLKFIPGIIALYNYYTNNKKTKNTIQLLEKTQKMFLGEIIFNSVNEVQLNLINTITLDILDSVFKITDKIRYDPNVQISKKTISNVSLKDLILDDSLCYDSFLAFIFKVQFYAGYNSLNKLENIKIKNELSFYKFITLVKFIFLTNIWNNREGHFSFSNVTFNYYNEKYLKEYIDLITNIKMDDESKQYALVYLISNNIDFIKYISNETIDRIFDTNTWIDEGILSFVEPIVLTDTYFSEKLITLINYKFPTLNIEVSHIKNIRDIDRNIKFLKKLNRSCYDLDIWLISYDSSDKAIEYLANLYLYYFKNGIVISSASRSLYQYGNVFYHNLIETIIKNADTYENMERFILNNAKKCNMVMCLDESKFVSDFYIKKYRQILLNEII